MTQGVAHLKTHHVLADVGIYFWGGCGGGEGHLEFEWNLEIWTCKNPFQIPWSLNLKCETIKHVLERKSTDTFLTKNDLAAEKILVRNSQKDESKKHIEILKK